MPRFNLIHIVESPSRNFQVHPTTLIAPKKRKISRSIKFTLCNIALAFRFAAISIMMIKCFYYFLCLFISHQTNSFYDYLCIHVLLRLFPHKKKLQRAKTIHKSRSPFFRTINPLLGQFLNCQTRFKNSPFLSSPHRLRCLFFCVICSTRFFHVQFQRL